MLSLPKRYEALTDAELENINENTWTKKFKITEKKVLPNGKYTFIYEFSD